MPKKKKSTTEKTSGPPPQNQPHHPHDQFFRGVMQHRKMASALIQFCAPAKVLEVIDSEQIQLTEDTFVDEHLKSHFADVCYSGITKGNKPFRVTIIFEHKSQKPSDSVLEQLNRYISNIWHRDIQQGRSLSLTLPILVYHGKTPLKKETPEMLFPGAPEVLLGFVPRFDYILLDLQRSPDEQLEQAGFILLQKFLLVLKNAKNQTFVDQNWKKIVIFAPGFHDERLALTILRIMMVYLGKINSPINKNIKNMSNLLSPEELAQAKPYILQILDEATEIGKAEGRAEGIEAGRAEGIALLIKQCIKNNPAFSDSEISKLLGVQVELVKKVRAGL